MNTISFHPVCSHAQIKEELTLERNGKSIAVQMLLSNGQHHGGETQTVGFLWRETEAHGVAALPTEMPRVCERAGRTVQMPYFSRKSATALA